jgi:hypothetical protein
MVRNLVLALGAAALLGLVAGVPDAHGVGACEVVRKAKPAKRGTGLRRPPLVVGDSSMLLGVRALASHGFEADARGCRSFAAGVALVARRRRAGTLPRLVVLALGANGPASQGQIERALRIVGRRRMLGLVAGGGNATSPRAYRRAARRHPSRIVLIDWRASGGPARYGGDGIHIGTEGEAEEAAFIARHTRPFMPPPARLRPPPSAKRAKDCGTAKRRRVFVAKGRMLCGRARELARTEVTEPIAGWRAFDWRIVGRPPWTAVYERRDGGVVVVVRPAPRPNG